MLDDDALVSVDDADRLHPHGRTGSCLNSSECDIQRPIRRSAIEVFTDLLHLGAERVCHPPELTLPLSGDSARKTHERPKIKRAAEAQAVHHEVWHCVVIVEADLVGMDRL